MPNFPSRCQHLKVNGTQCGSPALRRNRFCYFHKFHHEERILLQGDRAKSARRRPASITLPVLEDANSIQVSLMQIMRLIIGGQIDGKTAGLLLYALQTASTNLRHANFDPSMQTVVVDPRTVGQTPLNGYLWRESDFEQDEDEEDQPDVEPEISPIDAEAQLIMALGDKERIAEEAEDARLEARFQAQQTLNDQRRAAAQVESDRTAAACAAVTSTGHAILPPPKPPAKALSSDLPTSDPPKSDKERMDAVRARVTAHIREALPAIAAAVSAKQNAKNSG
jgi:hypothetical protein